MSTANVRLINSNSVPTYQTPLSSIPNRLIQQERASSSCLKVEPDLQRGYSTFNIVTLKNRDCENSVAFVAKCNNAHVTAKPNCGILKPQECISITVSIMSESVLTYFQTGLENVKDKFLIEYVRCSRTDITDENEIILERFRKKQWNRIIKKKKLSISLNEREYMEPVKSFIIPPISNSSSLQTSLNNSITSSNNRSIYSNNNNNNNNRTSIITPSPLNNTISPKTATTTIPNANIINDSSSILSSTTSNTATTSTSAVTNANSTLMTNSVTSPKSNINISSILVTQNQPNQQSSLSSSSSSSSASSLASLESPQNHNTLLLSPENTNTNSLESRCSIINQNNTLNSHNNTPTNYNNNNSIKSPINTITSNSDSISSLLLYDDIGKVEDDRVPWVKGLPIGKGVMGTVYKGMHKLTGDLLAIKEIILQQYDNKIIEQISTELAILKNIRHINIVHYYTTQIIKGNDTSPAYINIIMEYVSGGSLADIIKKFGKISEESAKTFVHQLLQGLEYLHENGITHRDIKGGNILLTETGIIKISDFGTSCSIFHDDPSKNNMQIGTPQWCSPEALKDQSLLEPKDWKKADVWSVGCFILEIITGEPPWGIFDNSQNAIFKIVEANTHPPIPEDGISKELRDFLEKCFIIDPKKRPTVQSLLVEKWLHSEEVRRVLNNIDRPQTAIPHCNSDLLSPVHGAGAVEIQENDLFVEKHKNKEKKNYLGIFSNKYKSKKKTVLTMGGITKQDRVLSASVAECYYPPIDKKKNEQMQQMQQQQQTPPPISPTVAITPHDFEVQAMLRKSTINISSTTSLPDINSKQNNNNNNKYSTPSHKEKKEEKEKEEEKKDNRQLSPSKFNYDNTTINKLSKDIKRQPISSIYKESKELVETLHTSASDVIIIKHEMNKQSDGSDGGCGVGNRNSKSIVKRISKSYENSDPIKNKTAVTLSSSSSSSSAVNPLKKLKSTKSGLMHRPIPPITDITIVNANANSTILGRPLTAPGKSKSGCILSASNSNTNTNGGNILSANTSYYLPENDPILIYLNNLRTLYSVVFGSVPCKYSEKELLDKCKTSECLELIDHLDYINRIFQHWISVINNKNNNSESNNILSLLVSSPFPKYYPNQYKYKSLKHFVIERIKKRIDNIRLSFLDGGVDNIKTVKVLNATANKLWKLYQLFNEKYLIINNHLVSFSNEDEKNKNNKNKKNNNQSIKKYIERIFKLLQVDTMKDEVYKTIAYLRVKCEMSTQSYSKLKSHPASPIDVDDNGNGGIPELHSPIKKPILKEKISLGNIRKEKEKDEEERLKKKKEEQKQKQKQKEEEEEKKKKMKKEEEEEAKKKIKESRDKELKVKKEKEEKEREEKLKKNKEEEEKRKIKENELRKKKIEVEKKEEKKKEEEKLKKIKPTKTTTTKPTTDNKKKAINIKPLSKKETAKPTTPTTPLCISPIKYNNNNNNNIKIIKTLLIEIIDQIINKHESEIVDSSPQLLLFPDSNKQSLKFPPPRLQRQPTTTSSSSSTSNSSSQNYSTEKSTLKSFTFSGESSPNLSILNESPNTLNRMLLNDNSILDTPTPGTSTSSYCYDEGFDEQYYYVIEDYKPVEANELELKRGDVVKAKKSKNDWWEAIDKKNKVGWVPKNFLEPMCRRSNDCLSFIEEECSMISRSASVMSMDGVVKKKGDKKKVVDEKVKMDIIKEEEN